jgi:peptidyl-prolyl cis-trans isomerase B (cyclophilin B)
LTSSSILTPVAVPAPGHASQTGSNPGGGLHYDSGIVRLLVAALAVTALVAASSACGGSDSESAGAATTAPETETVAATADGACAQVEFPEPRQTESEQPPREPLDAGTTYALTFETSCGTFTVTLDQETAPKASASLVALARSGYFDDTLFHRIVPGFVIQGGDPTQTGGGGPGYQTVDVPPADAAYTKGAVAMAKAASEAPGTAGSQFFVVTADDAQLLPEYAIVGRVTDGMNAVDAIGRHGDEFEQPTQPIVIEHVTVS